MPTQFICVDVTVDGKKVDGDNGMFMTIEDTDEMTCHRFSLPSSGARGVAMQTLLYLMIPLFFFDV
jgi:hypothetical protein